MENGCPKFHKFLPLYSKVAGQVLEIHNQTKSKMGDFLGDFHVIFEAAILQRTSDLFVATCSS